MRCCRLRFPLQPGNGEVCVCNVCASTFRWNETAQEWIEEIDIEEAWVQEFYSMWDNIRST